MATRPSSLRRRDIGLIVVLAMALLAFADSVWNYLMPGNGINGTEGALLVAVSTLLMLMATAVIAAKWGPRWVPIVLATLLVLDFIGTASAAYFLNAWLLLALVVLAAIGWAIHLARPTASPAGAM